MDINQAATYTARVLRKKGIPIKRYISGTSSSIYLMLQPDITIRFSDHPTTNRTTLHVTTPATKKQLDKIIQRACIIRAERNKR